MRYLRSAILASTALTLCVAPSPAGAADLGRPVYKAPPRAVAPYNWTGWYLGGNIGYSWGKADTSITSPGVPIFVPAHTLFYGLEPDGVIGGGQFGYKLQYTNWVFGFEADLQASGQKDSIARVDAIAGFCSTALPAVCPTNATNLTAKLNWFGTVRGVVGIAWDGLLIYGTGGFAYGKVELSGVTSFTQPFPIPATFTAPFNVSSTRGGYALGAGIEGAAWATNWTWRLEYLYIDLGTITESFVGPAGTYVARADVTDNIVRFALNYRFGDFGKAPVVAKY